MKKTIILLTSLMLFTVFLPSQEIIQNPEKPLSSNAGRILEVEEMFRITDESGDFYFKQPYGLQVADDGTIYLIDESQFLKFSADGKYLKNLMKKGQGPGEIQGSFFYYHLKDENIYIYDPMNAKIILMNQEGELIEEFRIFERYFGFIGLWKDKFILMKQIWPDMEVEDGKVVEIPTKICFISKEGNRINECFGIPSEVFLHPNLSTPFPRSVYIISKDGKTCITHDHDEYMISVLDLDKLEYIRKFKRAYSRVKRPKRRTSSRSSIKIPERKYEYDITDLFNFQGNLWVETSTENDKKGTLYDVFDNLGQYIDNFWLSTNGSLISTYRDYLFVREQDEDDNMCIVKYRVEVKKIK